MNIPKEAIENAIAGGWYRSFGNIPKLKMKDTSFQVWEGRVVMLNRSYAALALDPTFWQALGKALGWRESIDPTITVTGDWKSHAHRFYDLILQGQPTDTFWQELLSANQN